MNHCRICNQLEATRPEGPAEPRFCQRCWDTRLRQMFMEEDRFHVQRVFRGAEAEKYLVYHQEHASGSDAVGQVVAVHDRLSDHLEVSSYLSDKMDWNTTVPFIYEQGVECEITMLDVFLVVLEADLIPSWRCHSWTAEVNLCTGDPFYIDSHDRQREGDPADPET